MHQYSEIPFQILTSYQELFIMYNVDEIHVQYMFYTLVRLILHKVDYMYNMYV